MITTALDRSEQTEATSRQHDIGAQPDLPSPGSSLRPRYVYDPVGEVRVERLRLARQWQQEGSIYQAITAYTDMMVRYVGMAAAGAAAEELLTMARALEQQGKFYTVLDIFSKIEQSC